MEDPKRKTFFIRGRDSVNRLKQSVDEIVDDVQLTEDDDGEKKQIQISRKQSLRVRAHTHIKPYSVFTLAGGFQEFSYEQPNSARTGPLSSGNTLGFIFLTNGAIPIGQGEEGEAWLIGDDDPVLVQATFDPAIINGTSLSPNEDLVCTPQIDGGLRAVSNLSPEDDEDPNGNVTTGLIWVVRRYTPGGSEDDENDQIHDECSCSSSCFDPIRINNDPMVDDIELVQTDFGEFPALLLFGDFPIADAAPVEGETLPTRLTYRGNNLWNSGDPQEIFWSPDISVSEPTHIEFELTADYAEFRILAETDWYGFTDEDGEEQGQWVRETRTVISWRRDMNRVHQYCGIWVEKYYQADVTPVNDGLSNRAPLVKVDNAFCSLCVVHGNDAFNNCIPCNPAEDGWAHVLHIDPYRRPICYERKMTGVPNYGSFDTWEAGPLEFTKLDGSQEFPQSFTLWHDDTSLSFNQSPNWTGRAWTCFGTPRERTMPWNEIDALSDDQKFVTFDVAFRCGRFYQFCIGYLNPLFEDCAAEREFADYRFRDTRYFTNFPNSGSRVGRPCLHNSYGLSPPTIIKAGDSYPLSFNCEEGNGTVYIDMLLWMLTSDTEENDRNRIQGEWKQISAVYEWQVNLGNGSWYSLYAPGNPRSDVENPRGGDLTPFCEGAPQPPVPPA